MAMASRALETTDLCPEQGQSWGLKTVCHSVPTFRGLVI